MRKFIKFYNSPKIVLHTLALKQMNWKLIIAMLCIFIGLGCRKNKCESVIIFESGYVDAGMTFKAFTDKPEGIWVTWINPQGKVVSVLDTLNINPAKPSMSGQWQAVLSGGDCKETAKTFYLHCREVIPCPMSSYRFEMKDEQGPFYDSASFTHSFIDTSSGQWIVRASDINTGFSLRLTFHKGIRLPRFGMFTLNPTLFNEDEVNISYTYKGNQEDLYSYTSFLYVEQKPEGKWLFTLCPVRYNIFVPRRVSFQLLSS